jgi:methylated-DNA-protein-cysteine methyltransferase-like protein
VGVPGSYQRIYRVTRRIPRGRVATYGQIAELAGLGGHARQVGYAMHALPFDSDVPWHRVINAQGRISLRAEDVGAQVQAKLLAKEGVKLGASGRIDLARYRWKPRTRAV